ncbi:hypothetical protein [Streptomyces sp. NPDC059466]|uniref:hypothetical protein n=1 Tax=unclassified Streptomyces TaxID=2593676 RepID=UPI00367BCDE9
MSKCRLGEDGAETERTDFTWDDTRLAEHRTADGRVATWDYAPGTHRPLTQTTHRSAEATLDASHLARLAEDTTADRTLSFHAVVTDSVGKPTELVSAEGELA